MDSVTFALTEPDSASAIGALGRLGFEVATPRSVTTTLLDSFDGRLHRAGLRLVMCSDAGGGHELVLSGSGAVPAHLEVGSTPRLPADLPPGPFRSRVASAVGIRALLPQLQVTATNTSCSWRNASDKIVATAEIREGIRVPDRPDVRCPSTIEVQGVPGFPKHRRRAVAALRELGLDAAGADTLERCAAAADVDLAGFVASATVDLDPRMTAIDGDRAVLANLATAIVANWQGTIDRADPEFLHDLRIAVRRTRTVLGEARSVLPASVLGPARDEFRRLARLTGPPRDLDVYLLEWSQYTEPLGPEVVGALAPVRDLLEQRCTEVYHELERAMRSERATRLVQEWSTWLAQPVAVAVAVGDHGSRAERPLGRLVAQRIARAHDVLITHGRRIGPDTPAEHVHDLRKDAKRLRYLIECFGSLLPDRPRARSVKRLKGLQENLGEHQDAEVHVVLLRDIARRLHEDGASADTLVAIGQLAERLDQQRVAARAEFAERFAAYDRPATERALAAMLDGIDR